MQQSITALVLALLVHAACAAAPLTEISNFRQYSNQFASAGQPTQAQLGDLRNAGFQRVIYIAMNDSQSALAGEDRMVKELGMSYVHIPVRYDQPSPEDFEIFATLMRASRAKTLLHCQVNYRASVFSFLYRVIYGGVPIKQAKADLNSVWQPEGIWFQFIKTVLGRHDINYRCEGCDWGNADRPA